MFRILRVLAVVVSALVPIVAVILAAIVYQLLLRPMPPRAEPVRIDIERGEPFALTARRLEAEGLIPNATALEWLARLTGTDHRVKHGPYALGGGESAFELFGKMRRGESLLVRVTIPEGFAIADIARTLEATDLGEAENLVALAHDPDFAAELDVPAESLEGYLFPDTYFFSPLATPESILRVMVARCRRVLEEDLAARAVEAGMSVHELVTLASVVEKETGAAHERPLVAAVFANRLALGMMLQSDPTVIYGVEGFDGNLTRAHLQTPTPYNTYAMVGLPAGPIASPGLDSLRAVLEPADVDFLYFVSKNDGTHHFSKTLAEHEAAVDRYQRRRQRRSGRRRVREGG